MITINRAYKRIFQELLLKHSNLLQLNNKIMKIMKQLIKRSLATNLK